MKKLYNFALIVILIIGVTSSFAFQFKQLKIFPNLKNNPQIVYYKNTSPQITYFYASNSINGPFTSPATISTQDSLYLKMDVTPGGSVHSMFFIDLDENGTIDLTDILIGQDVFPDNAVGRDLDPTPGVIIVSLETGMLPAMQVIARASEFGNPEPIYVYGIVKFVNPPGQFNFTGTVYDLETSQPIPGAMVFASKIFSKNFYKSSEEKFYINVNDTPIETNINDYDIFGGNWEIINNELYQNSKNYNGPPDMRIIYKYFNFKFFTISTDMTVIDDDNLPYSIGLLFKVLDENNYYYVYCGHSGEIGLAKFLNGNWYLLHSQYFDPLPLGTKINLKVKIEENGVSVYSNNVFRYFVPIDNYDFDFGSIGFCTGWGATGKFSNVKIELTPSIIGDVTDQNGIFQLQLDPGMYFVRVEDFTRKYQSFDTLIFINGDLNQDFYLQKLSSYIRGFVRDEQGNPIQSALVYARVNNWDNYTMTDQNGHYVLFVPPGDGRLGIDNESLQPNYITPQERPFTISFGDSIVDNEISNFVCYTANDSIVGRVIDNIHMPPIPQYVVAAWTSELNSYVETLTDGNGFYKLRVHSNPLTFISYNVWVQTEHWDYPFPEDVYVDTTYFNVLPGSTVNFRILPAETSAVDPFNGNYNMPDQSKWRIFSFGDAWGPESMVLCVNDRLVAKCNSREFLSGVGVMSRKPYSVKDREFRIYLIPQDLGEFNTAHILFTNSIRYDHPYNMNRWIQLTWSGTPLTGGWRLDVWSNNNILNLWSSNDQNGGHILFQFFSNPKKLVLKIDGVVRYEGPYGIDLPVAYYYAFTQNYFTNPATPVYFDEFYVGAIGTSEVKQIGGEIPANFKLEQNYPNPFNPVSNIRYQLSDNSFVTLKVYNTLGQEISILINAEQKPGHYEIQFSANNLPSGVYFYRLNAYDVNSGRLLFTDIKKAVVVK